MYGSTCHLVSILSFEENREVFAEFEKRSFIDANTNLTDFIWMGLTNQPFIKGKNIKLSIDLKCIIVHTKRKGGFSKIDPKSMHDRF